MEGSNGPRQHIFISYARSDGELFARQLHERLEKEHLPCWRDRLDLEGGVDFWRQLEAAIAVARWLVIVLTPRALKSEWTAREWWEARKHGVPICPVWPLEETALAANLVTSRLPAGMRRSHVYMPFTAEKGSEVRADEEWRNLLSTLRLDKEVTRTLFMAPPLQPDYIDRPEETTVALSALLPAPEGQRPAITVLHGAGGMGKTTLAKALALRDEITDAFHDGVLWITLGTRPVLVDIVADLCRALGRYGHFSDIDAAATHLRAVLENRFCLLVIDDVWRVSDLQPFIELGPTVAVLVTTRVAEVARLAGERARSAVKQMTRHQSANYLAGIVGRNARIRYRCSELARQLGHWPLLLRLAGGQLRAQLDYGESPERAIQWVSETLRQNGVTALDADPSTDDFENTRTRDRAVAVSIGGSLGLLTGPEREAFVDLGVFPDDVDIPLSTAAQLWAVPDGRGIALRLANLSLVDLHLGATPSLRLHDQIHHFTARRLKDDGRWPQTHRRLLMTWNDLSALPDDYAWRWVCHHLKEAGQEDRLATLLSDYDGIARRLRAKSAGVHRLAADYELIGELPDGAHIGRVIQRASHILATQPDLLSQQLVGRLTRKSTVCDSLRERARASNPESALLPLTPSLTTQLRISHQVLRHDDQVSALALTGDGRVVTAGRDGRIFLAHLQGGEPVLLAHHRDTWSVLLLASDARVVAGGRDGRVYCLSLDGGEPIVLAKHLGGLVGTVSHLALTGDGRIVSAAWDGAVYLATLEGDGARLLVRHEGPVTALAVSPDGRIVTGGQDGRVYCTRLAGGESMILVEHERSNDGGVFSVGQLVLTADGRVVSSGEEDGRVYCVSLDGGEPVLLAQHRGPVSTLLSLGDGRVITGGRVDGRLCCVPLEGGTPQVIAEAPGGVRDAVLTGDGGIVYVTGYPEESEGVPSVCRVRWSRAARRIQTIGLTDVTHGGRPRHHRDRGRSRGLPRWQRTEACREARRQRVVRGTHR